MCFGSGTNTTTSTNTPYKGFKNLIDQGTKDALTLYKNGDGSAINTTSQVVPWSNQTMSGMQGIMGMANANSNGKGLTGSLQDIINNGGYSDYQKGALNNMQNTTNALGKNGLSNSQDSVLNRFQNQLQGLGKNGLTGVQDRIMQNYGQLANSSYNPNANPGAQGVLDAAIRDTTNATNLNAASAGRYGSGTHEGVLAQKVGDLSSNFRYNDFNNWLGRRDNAQQQAANLSQTGLGNVNTFGQNISNLGQQGINNTNTMNGALFNASQAGLNNMTNAYSGMKLPYQDQMGVGSMLEDLSKRELADQNRLFDAKNNQGWSQIQRLLGIANGGSGYATTTQTSPGANPFLQTLGGISTGAGLLGTLGIL